MNQRVVLSFAAHCKQNVANDDYHFCVFKILKTKRTCMTWYEIYDCRLQKKIHCQRWKLSSANLNFMIAILHIYILLLKVKLVKINKYSDHKITQA